MSICVAFALAGAVVGWVGGACLGLVLNVLGGGADVLYIATWGLMVGPFVFGWMGLCVAVLLAVFRAAARQDPELVQRAQTIQRLRADSEPDA
jgi:hypothetical protein